MINLYIFSNKSRGGLYGVGTYIRELITALRSKSNSIHIHVVHILCDQLQIETKEVKDVSYWYFPEPISKEWNLLDQEQRKVYSRNIVYLLRNYIQDQKNLVFHLNSYRDKSLALELKIAFDCKVITVTHFSEWSSVIHDNLEKLRIILRKKETNELLERYQETLNEINDLKKYEGYIDLTSKKEELKEIKKQMTSNQDIQEYYQSYYEINRLLDHVTQIIFKDISQILDTTGYKL